MADTVRQVSGSLFAGAVDVISNPKHSYWVAPSVLLVDAVLCALIIRSVDYTEIDWRAYMQQIKHFSNGERNYTMIKGDTGPLVYPAIHVYIYKALYDITQGGDFIVLAQAIFAFVYLINMGLAMACYKNANVFHPCVCMLFVANGREAFWATTLLYQNEQWAWGSIVFSFGLGVKMNLLLILPAMLLLVYQKMGPKQAFLQIHHILQVQVLSALPFLMESSVGYLSRAFDFSRQFLYKWSVNWQFVSEEVFLSKAFSYSLLTLHVSLLALFALSRWMKPLGRSPVDLIRRFNIEPPAFVKERINRQINSDFILTTILTANVIGTLCARTLHFQFFSWISWATPFLLWRSGLPPLLQILLWFGQELAWNHFPPDPLSSKIVVGVLAVMVVEIWLGTDDDGSSARSKVVSAKHPQTRNPIGQKGSSVKGQRKAANDSIENSVAGQKRE